MTVQKAKVVYVMDCGAELMDKIRREANHWADGGANICLTGEDALEITELYEALSGMYADCDVICCE